MSVKPASVLPPPPSKSVLNDLDESITDISTRNNIQTEIVEPSVTTVNVAVPKKRIVISVPGEKFSYNFLMSWTVALHSIWESGKYELVISPGTSTFLPFARLQTLGVDVKRGINQKPFNGTLDYFAYITIDPNIIFNAQSILELLKALEVQPVVSGFYSLPDGKSFSAAKTFDSQYFATNGGLKCLNTEDMKEYKESNPENPFMSVAYTGLGFFGCRKEVLDALQYPYFHAPLQRIFNEEGLEMVDLCSDDVAFCKSIQNAGYTIHLHTGLRIGSELSVII